MMQESRAVARKPRDAAAVVFGLKFAENIHYKFKSSQTSKARLQSSKHTGAKPNLTQVNLKSSQCDWRTQAHMCLYARIFIHTNYFNQKMYFNTH